MTGWGQLSAEGPDPDILQEVSVRTMSNQQCREKNMYEDGAITDFMICTEEPGKGFCSGDSGGPLAVEGQDGTFSLIGIVSFSHEPCAAPGWPDVFTRVTALTVWIENNRSPLDDYIYVI